MIQSSWVHWLVAGSYGLASMWFAYRYLKDDPGVEKDLAGIFAIVFGAVGIFTIGIVMEIL